MTKAYMFGDNKSVITSATIPQSLLNKSPNMLSYHRVREAIAAKILVNTGTHLIKIEVIYSVNVGNMQKLMTQLGNYLTTKVIHPS